MDKKDLTVPASIKNKIGYSSSSSFEDRREIDQGPVYFKNSRELIDESLSILRANFWFFFKIISVVSFISLFLSFVVKDFLGLAIYSVISFFFGIFWQVSFICAIKEEGGGVSAFFKNGLIKIFPFIWVSFLMGIIVFSGFILLIIPGIIFSVWFSLSYYVLVWEDLRGLSAIKASKNLVSKYWWRVLWRYFVLYVFLLLFLFVFTFIFSFLITFFAIKITSRSIDFDDHLLFSLHPVFQKAFEGCGL